MKADDRQLYFDFAAQPVASEKDELVPLEEKRESASASPVVAISGAWRKLRGGKGLHVDDEWTARVSRWLGALDHPELAHGLTVQWNTRLQSTAGLAYYTEKRIEVNTELRRFAPEEPERTIKHELAHIIAHHRAGKRRIRAHGPEWRQACADLGIPDESRCHNLPLGRRRIRRKFAYQCRFCGEVVARVRPLERDSACYSCCREHNRGRYSGRYLLEEISLEVARRLMPAYFEAC
ncbi:MAG: SprT-like domain-containing protein [Verrucomicrobiota bacterium]